MSPLRRTIENPSFSVLGSQNQAVLWPRPVVHKWIAGHCILQQARIDHVIHDVDAIFEQGVFRPIAPVSLPAGARVHLRVKEENGETFAAPQSSTHYTAWLEQLAGRWQGDFSIADEGDFESRDALS
jgi:predicted DNA-binding antitoxin AbrB/MazE fold protein